MIDSPARAVQCTRCGEWCLLGQCNGFKTIVTARPLNLDGYRAALMAGLDVYRLSPTRKLRPIVPGDNVSAFLPLLAHPCDSWSAVPLKAPQRGAQSLCPGLAGCTRCTPGQRTCEVCDPAPFDHGLLVRELGARLVEVIIDGKTVWSE